MPILQKSRTRGVFLRVFDGKFARYFGGFVAQVDVFVERKC